MSADEDDLLDLWGERRPNSGHSCRIKVSEALDGIAVTVAPED